MTPTAPEIKFNYSADADVLFIGLGSFEPSYSEEVDDLLLVERGLFTDEITGFRVLGVKHNRIEAVYVQQVINRVLQDEPNRLEKLLELKKAAQSQLPELVTQGLRSDRSLSDFAAT